jgi:hypothetical protein
MRSLIWLKAASHDPAQFSSTSPTSEKGNRHHIQLLHAAVEGITQTAILIHGHNLEARDGRENK